jgi:hypothetical protein
MTPDKLERLEREGARLEGNPTFSIFYQLSLMHDVIEAMKESKRVSKETQTTNNQPKTGKAAGPTSPRRN